MSPNFKLNRVALAIALASSVATSAHAQSLNSTTATQDVDTSEQPVAELGTIVVSASGFEQQIKDAPASISVVTREELEKNPIKTLSM